MKVIFANVFDKHSRFTRQQTLQKIFLRSLE